MAEEKKIKLNEEVLTEQEFEKRKKEVEKMKGASLVEIAPNVYKIRFHD